MSIDAGLDRQDLYAVPTNAVQAPWTQLCSHCQVHEEEGQWHWGALRYLSWYTILAQPYSLRMCRRTVSSWKKSWMASVCSCISEVKSSAITQGRQLAVCLGFGDLITPSIGRIKITLWDYRNLYKTFSWSVLFEVSLREEQIRGLADSAHSHLDSFESRRVGSAV